MGVATLPRPLCAFLNFPWMATPLCSRRLLADLGYSIVQKVDLQSCGVSAVDLEPVVVSVPIPGVRAF